MENKNRVEVQETQVGGDFTGRDKNIYNFPTKQAQTAYVKDLYKRFEKEKRENPEFKDICEELNYYISQNGKEGIIGLENKLEAGNRHILVRYAKEVKEQFHKKLLKVSQYSLVAQDINVHILAKVRSAFVMEIYSLILEGKSQESINLLIRERIINPIMTELGINIFKYTEDDIMGMIFFLTGNCHIKWTK
jgi:uncharacterized membrane-anchored protein